MPSITSLLLLGLTTLSATLTAAAPTPEVITAQVIISDIQSIDNGVKNLTAALHAYSGTAASEVPIGADITAIHLANRKAYADANARTTPFSAADIKAIVDYTNQSVGIDIPNSVDVLESKKPLFQASFQDPVILAGLQLLKYDHDTFSAALMNKTTGDQVQGNAVVKKIDDALQNGIDFFSS